MVAIVTPSHPAPPDAQPVWDIARLFPPQGHWDEDEYLSLDTNHLVEFTDGYVEVLPMPKMSHQLIVKYLVGQLETFADSSKGGTVLFAPFRVRIRSGKFREPDVCFMLAGHADRMKDEYWEGADLVMEVVSDDAESRLRNHEKKRLDYAEARIGEYWVIDPTEQRISQFILAGQAYAEPVHFGRGHRMSSVIAQGFEVEVDKVLGAVTPK